MRWKRGCASSLSERAACRSGDDDDELVGDDVAPPGGVHEALALRLVHRLLVGADEDVDRRAALGDLLQQRAGSAEVEEHLAPGVGGLEHRPDLLERVAEARGRRDGQLGGVRRERSCERRDGEEAAQTGG